MSNFHGKSFAFVASVVGAAFMTGAVAAETAAPAPAVNAPAANAPPRVAAIGKRHKKPNKKVAPSIVVVVTNSRAVALTELDATPSGGTLPKAIVSNLAPRQNTFGVGRDRQVLLVRPAWHLCRRIEWRFDKRRFVQGYES
jgi:hypothetical protein